MDKRGFFDIEFDMPLILALALGAATGFISLIVVKGSGTGIFWKVLTFAASAVAGTVVSYFIFNKD